MFRFHGLELCFLVLGKPGQRRHNKSNHHGHSNELHFESPFRIPSLILNRSVSQLVCRSPVASSWQRSEEHTSELQSRLHLVCRLLLEKKNRPALSLGRPSPPCSDQLARGLAAHGVARILLPPGLGMGIGRLLCLRRALARLRAEVSDC